MGADSSKREQLGKDGMMSEGVVLLANVQH